ncbi:MAG TPA: hypothetical protein VJX67_16355 [Blastocatellia bacterium]|nr:hypothetical protein [Blastocatellia bacterium]
MRPIKLTVVMVLLSAVAGGVWTRGGSANQVAGRSPRSAAAGSSKQADQIKDLEQRAAREPGSAELRQKLGIAYFYKARLGDAESADKSIAVLEQQIKAAPDDIASARWLGLSDFVKVGLLDRQRASSEEMAAALTKTLAAFQLVLDRLPNDAVALSAHGAALLFLARNKRSMDLFTRGIDEMNRAVSTNPSDIDPKLLRSLTLLNLPGQFRSPQVLTGDFAAILKGMQAGYNDRARAVLEVLLGDAYIEAKQDTLAKSEYEAAATLPQPAAEVARTRLAAMAQGQPVTQAIQKYHEMAVQCASCHNR